MKAPKQKKPDIKEKIGLLKSGKVKKSSEPETKKKLGAFSKLKSADEALNLIKGNDDNVKVKFNKKDKKGPLPSTVLSTDSTKNRVKGNTNFTSASEGSKKKSPKGNKSKIELSNGSHKIDKKPPPKSVNDVENNTSPVKLTTDKKKVQLPPFSLDSPVLTPIKSNTNVSPQVNSPEVQLGLEIEKALSPKSKRMKKKLLLKQKLQSEGKVEVLKKVGGDKTDEKTDGSSDSSPKKAKRRRKKKAGKGETKEEDTLVKTGGATSSSGGESDSPSKKKKRNRKKKGKGQTEKTEDGGPKPSEVPATSTSTTGSSSSTPAESSESSGQKKKRKRRRRPRSTSQSAPEPSVIKEDTATSALKALLKVSKSKQSAQKDLFGDDKAIYLSCNLFKVTPPSVLHIPLAHSILPENPDVLLITPDVKGKRSQPEEAIDFYKDLLKQKGVNFITEVMPIRKLKKEYTTFEHRQKLANRFDAVLVDGRVGKMARIGRRFARTKKCVVAVNLKQEDWKATLENGLRKVAIFSNGRGLSLSVKCGREGMPIDHIAENIITIGKWLSQDSDVIGTQKNIQSIYVKTALSESFPIYVSLGTGKDVELPKGKKSKASEGPIEGELSTLLQANVIVHPSGNVKVKKLKAVEADSEDESPPKKAKLADKNAQPAKAADKKKTNKKVAPTSSSDEEETEDEEIFDPGSDFELMSDEEGGEDEEVESDVGEEGSEDEEVESDVDEEGSEDEEVESGEEEGSDAELDDDSSDSDVEDKITAAESEYLQEVRKLQDEIAKKKKKPGNKGASAIKPLFAAGKAPSVEKKGDQSKQAKEVQQKQQKPVQLNGKMSQKKGVHPPSPPNVAGKKKGGGGQNQQQQNKKGVVQPTKKQEDEKQKAGAKNQPQQSPKAKNQQGNQQQQGKKAKPDGPLKRKFENANNQPSSMKKPQGDGKKFKKK